MCIKDTPTIIIITCFCHRHHAPGIMQYYFFPTACKFKETPASFVSDGIFQIAIFIRPWESDPGIKKGKHVNACCFSASSCDLLSQPSITEVGLKQHTERLSSSVSSFPSTVCLLAQFTNYLLVAQCSTNKISCVGERGRGRGKQQNDKHREKRTNREQTVMWRNSRGDRNTERYRTKYLCTNRIR